MTKLEELNEAIDIYILFARKLNYFSWVMLYLEDNLQDLELGGTFSRNC